MTIGGLSIGVTPLDMAHAYETIAHGGQRVSGTLAEDDAPVGIQEVVSPSSPLPDGSHRDVNHVRTKPVLPPGVAATETEMLETVLQYGTAKAAALDEFAAGKTGTTSNYVDAWFVGWNHKYTVAVWVGYPEGARAMSTDYDGGPVLGGTFPALIWHNFMTSALGIEKERAEHAAHPEGSASSGGASTSSTSEAETNAPATKAPAPSQTPAPTTGAGKEGTGKSTTPGAGEAGTGAAGAGGAEQEHAASPAPATPTPEAPSAPPPPPRPRQRRPHRPRRRAGSAPGASSADQVTSAGPSGPARVASPARRRAVGSGRGHVQVAHEHREHPRVVLNLLLLFYGRGPRDRLAGAERLPELRTGNLDLLDARSDRSVPAKAGRDASGRCVGLQQCAAVEKLLVENVILTRSTATGRGESSPAVDLEEIFRSRPRLERPASCLERMFGRAEEQGAPIGLGREDQSQEPRHLLSTIGLCVEVQALEVPLGVGDRQILGSAAAC